MNTKVLIEVKGGVVQTVYATNRDIEVEVLDHDNDETGYGMTPSDDFLPIYNSAHEVL